MEQVYQNTSYTAAGRFEFGKNWTRFLGDIDETRIAAAQESIGSRLNVSSLEGTSFLDIGCGSGLFSLAARRLGARVMSFDYDPASVSCALELKRRFSPDDPHWIVSQGSVLDAEYLRSLGTFDVVYSWGVLHHTGAMWEALDKVSRLVKPGGQLFIAIYNDAGRSTRRWRAIKRAYATKPLLRAPLLALCGGYLAAARRAVRVTNPSRFFEHREPGRGMSTATDLVDWVGGYPFEFAAPGEIFDFYHARGFTLTGLTTYSGNACNEFVFRRTARSS